MRIGIIAEGRSDQAVIANILKGILNLDRASMTFIRPELEIDETDLSQMSPEGFSNWTLVKKECEERSKLDEFLNGFDEERFVVIHLDTAEVHLAGYEVPRPEKNDNPDYSILLRKNVIDRVNKWLDNQFGGQLFYAITIEETEAWLLTIHENLDKDTCQHNTPKERLFRTLNRKLTGRDRKVLTMSNILEQYDELSKDFRKQRLLLRYVEKNESLKLFCESLKNSKQFS